MSPLPNSSGVSSGAAGASDRQRQASGNEAGTVAYRTSSVNLTKDAYRCFRKKRYREAILLCEKVTAAVPHEPYPYFLLALCHLYSDRFESADLALNRIQRIDPDYPPLLQLRAFLQLKAAPDRDSALRAYLDCLERQPRDKMLISGRKMLGAAPSFQLFQKKIRLTDCVAVPAPPRRMATAAVKKNVSVRNPVFPRRARSGIAARRVFVVLALLVAGVALSYLAWPRLAELARSRPTAFPDFREIDSVTISGTEYDLIKKINRDRSREFYYSVTDLTADFTRARELIQKGEYNRAVLSLNRIRNSNASFMVKEKANFLVDFVRNIEDRAYEKPSFLSVAEKRYLYHGYALTWKGRVANLRRTGSSDVFSLLADYRERDVFSGIADVYSDLGVAIENGDMIEVDALVLDVESQGRPYLTARAMRRLR
jgi:tetratricopeptide (TPR) repeat protein